MVVLVRVIYSYAEKINSKILVTDRTEICFTLMLHKIKRLYSEVQGDDSFACLVVTSPGYSVLAYGSEERELENCT